MTADLVPFVPGWGPIPVDCDAEVDALIDLWVPAAEDWRDRERRVGRTRDGRTTLTLIVAGRETAFDTTSYAGSVALLRGETDTTATMDVVARRAQAFSAENPPHHPGSVARFPVPSERYSRSIEVPLPVVAIDRGKRGLYAPPRVALLSWPAAEPAGIGEFPGFDPGAWPPPRLGDWPPASLGSVSPRGLQAAVARFSACWVRILDAALSGRLDNVSPWDREHARALRQLLDPPRMAAAYRGLNPGFDDWLSSGQ